MKVVFAFAQQTSNFAAVNSQALLALGSLRTWSTWYGSAIAVTCLESDVAHGGVQSVMLMRVLCRSCS